MVGGQVASADTYNDPNRTKWGSEDLFDYTTNGPFGITTHDAYQVLESVHFHRTGNAANTASSWSQTATTYDSTFGSVASVSSTSSGDTATDRTDTCATFSYAYNNAPLVWLIDMPKVAVTQAGACPASGPITGATLSRTDTYYDQMTSPATAATEGNVLRVDAYDDYGPPTHYVSSTATFDTLGRVVTATDSHHNVTTTAYTPATTGPVTAVAVTNALGQTTTTTLDPYRSQPVSVAVTPAGTGPTRTTTAKYDEFGRLIQVWQPLVTVTPSVAYAYTLSNTTASSVQTTTRQDASTVVSSWTYLDSFGRPRDTQGPSPTSTGRIVTMVTYDEQGRPWVTTAPFTQSNAPGSGAASVNLATVPMVTTAGYDAFGRQVSATTSETNGTAQVTRWATTTGFDGLATTVHPPPAAAAPAPLTGTQPTYGDTVTTVDPLGRVLSVAEHTGTVGVGGDTVSATTSRQYDASGALVKLMDGAGNPTTYTYDLLGRRTGSVDPDAGASSTAYSDAGFSWATYSAAAANANLYSTTTSTDARSIRVRATTDVLGRTVESDSSPTGSSTWSRLSTSLFDDSFDGNKHWPGQLTRSTSFVGATSLTNGTPYITDLAYDDQMRPVGKTVTVPAAEGALGGTYVFGSTFDDAGHQTSLAYPAAGGLSAETVSTGFDGEGFTGALTSSLAGAPTPLAAAPSFDAVGRLTGRTLGTGVGKVATGYSFAGTAQRLSEVTAAVGTSTPVTVRDDTYLFDSSGNPLSVRDVVAGQSQCYGYDTRNRLVSAFTSGTQTCAAGSGNVVGPDPFKETYGYDPTSNNITSITRGTGTLVTTNQVYAAAGHAHAPSSTTGGVVSGFTYNADGTMATRTGAGAASYTWDAQGRMTGATPQGGSATTMVYNADGSRLLRKDPGSTTLYLDGTELKLTGTTVAGTRYYTHGGTTIGMRTSAGLTWVLGDTQGSFSLTVNAATGAVARQRYLPYGGLRNTAPVFGTERGWLGKTADTTTGLDYLGARYYDPQLAHFTSPDPLLSPDDPKSYSAYSYANDNPAAYSDPSGLRPPTDECDSRCIAGIQKSQSDANAKQAQIAVAIFAQASADYFQFTTGQSAGTRLSAAYADLLHGSLTAADPSSLTDLQRAVRDSYLDASGYAQDDPWGNAILAGAVGGLAGPVRSGIKAGASRVFRAFAGAAVEEAVEGAAAGLADVIENIPAATGKYYLYQGTRVGGKLTSVLPRIGPLVLLGT